MNIGIDGYEANVTHRVGIGQFAFQLLKAIYQIDTLNRYTIFLPSKPLNDMPEQSSGWNYHLGRASSLWTIGQLPKLIKTEKLDIFFTPTHYLPWFASLPKIMSIMDLSYLHYPEMFRFQDLVKLKYMTQLSVKRAQKILTISKFTKNEIIEHYDYPKDDIVVIYPGIDHLVKPPTDSTARIKRKLKLDKFLLFVGTIQPRKNLSRLISAFELLDQSDIQLVLVGKKGWLYSQLFDQIKTSPKTDKITWLDFIEHQDLIGLYMHAECLVLPSLYEGFGIPVIEAMSVGCPVVVSRSSSLEEITEGKAVYVKPQDIQDIAQGISNILKLSSIERKSIIVQGKVHAQKFTWENCAKTTISVFEKLCSI